MKSKYFVDIKVNVSIHDAVNKRERMNYRNTLLARSGMRACAVFCLYLLELVVLRAVSQSVLISARYLFLRHDHLACGRPIRVVTSVRSSAKKNTTSAPTRKIEQHQTTYAWLPRIIYWTLLFLIDNSIQHS